MKLENLLVDAAVPADIAAAAAGYREQENVVWRTARWSPKSLAPLLKRLTTGSSRILAGLPPDRRLAAWNGAIDELLDPTSPSRQALDTTLPTLLRLSPAGFDAGLNTLLEGVRGAAAEEVFAAARGRTPDAGLTAVILASNIPGLAVQPVLPALALGVPLLIKSSSAEPLFAPALLAALARREPELASAFAAIVWPGGQRRLEDVVFAGASRILAYGGGATIDALAGRLGGRLVAYGPKLSVAAIGAGEAPESVAAGLARDIALFDQRGCLSIQAIFTAGDAVALARALARALEKLARRWPPGTMSTVEAARIQQIRAETTMRGLEMIPLDLAAGTVILEPEPWLVPSPGWRLVRIHPLEDLAELPDRLAGWNGRIQGAALAGADAQCLTAALEGLGVSRFAPPGELQRAPATWANGGLAPLDAYGARPRNAAPENTPSTD